MNGKVEGVLTGKLEGRVRGLVRTGYEAVDAGVEVSPARWKKYNTVIFQPLLGLEKKDVFRRRKQLLST